jgi:hypothetical protein
VYGDGQILNPLVAYLYLALLNNVSQAWAMYCLIIFYRATYQELAPIRPFYKFCTVKAVVFLSFWQGQTLLFMVKMQWIKVSQRETKTDYDAAEVATAMQEFLICVEMFFAAIAHSYAFPPSEYFGTFICTIVFALLLFAHMNVVFYRCSDSDGTAYDGQHKGHVRPA